MAELVMAIDYLHKLGIMFRGPGLYLNPLTLNP
jgi:hypothetical protein